MDSQSFSDLLQSLTEKTKPPKVTSKQLIRENFEMIEEVLAKGWSIDDIVTKLNSGTANAGDGIHITVATLRRYCYDIRKERENNTHK